jgi:hypothetical protein
MDTQNKMILHHLRTQRRITPMTALESYGCFRLAARIHDLKELGHHIETEMVVCDLTGSRYAQYTLIKEASHEMAKASG